MSLEKLRHVRPSGLPLVRRVTEWAHGATDYRQAIADMTRPMSHNPDVDAFVRYATLAANGHNTQPWRFTVEDETIVITPDIGRRTPVVDPDDHHLYASLGCAAENLAIAARARGRAGTVAFAGRGEGAVHVGMSRARGEETALFAAIPRRACSRALYSGAVLPPAERGLLETASRMPGVDIRFITDKPGIEAVLALVIDGNSRQLDNPAFVKELRQWIRFNAAAAAADRDGLYSAATGNPALPSWLGRMIFARVLDKATENDKYARQVRSSAGLAVFIGGDNDPAHWVAAGRACQRFALQATALGIRYAFVNQPVEEPAVRTRLAGELGVGDRRPNLVVRFGYGPAMPRTLRRPPCAVMA